MNNDDRAKFEALKDPVHKAALVLLRHHLDNAEVHPCDWNDDNARAAQCIPEVQALHTALASAQAASAEPVLFIERGDLDRLTAVGAEHQATFVSNYHSVNFDTPLYTTTPAPAVAPAAVTEALRKLVVMARTSGGTAGPDAELLAACDEASDILAALATRTP